MAMTTLTIVTGLKQTLSSDNKSSNNLRDVSFSSYLSTNEENFVRKLAKSSPDMTANDHFLRRKKEEDGEIGVFSAEKYFNGVIDVESPRIQRIIIPNKHDQPKKDEQIDFVPMKPKLNPATPSVLGSESSWNSQTALLQQKKTWQTETNNPNGKIKKNLLASFGCKCACSDKDSIDVDDEHVTEISFKKHINPSDLLQSKAIAEEIITKPSSGSSLLSQEINSASGNLEVPRKSLEVFGSPVQDKKSKSFRIERRISFLSWDAPKRMEESDYSDAPSGLFNNENESDASSSDLFEIEILKANPFLARQGSDAASGCVTPTTGYPPSEASIEWSVVTASAADFSVMSDYEELRPTAAAVLNFRRTANPKISSTVKETPRRSPGIFLGCNSSKAVKVAGDAHRTTAYDPRIRPVSNSYMEVSSSPPENKQRAFSTLSLPRSKPSQSSRLFYIQ